MKTRAKKCKLCNLPRTLVKDGYCQFCFLFREQIRHNIELAKKVLRELGEL